MDIAENRKALRTGNYGAGQHGRYAKYTYYFIHFPIDFRLENYTKIMTKTTKSSHNFRRAEKVDKVKNRPLLT
jgi:hypothetical protein